MTQDLRKLRRYRRRWRVERLFSWLLSFRRLITRFAQSAYPVTLAAMPSERRARL